MNLTKKGVGGKSNIRRLSAMGEKVMNRAALEGGSRNGRRVMRKLRTKYGDEVIDREIQNLKSRS